MKKLAQGLILVLNGIYAITVFLSIAMPKKTNEILEFLGIRQKNFLLITKLDKFDKINFKKLEKPFFPRKN
ncbi:hypothetical protein V2P59_02270 [Mesomycoplasma hyopneumoniae]